METKYSKDMQSGKTPPTSVLDETLNNLMERPQSWWSEECGTAPLNLLSGPLDRVISTDK